MSDLKRLIAETEKALAAEKKRTRDDLPTMIDLVVTYIKVARFDDQSILADALELEERIEKALK